MHVSQIILTLSFYGQATLKCRNALPLKLSNFKDQIFELRVICSGVMKLDKIDKFFLQIIARMPRGASEKHLSWRRIVKLSLRSFLSNFKIIFHL